MRGRVVTVTPAGRKRNIEILSAYLLQNRAHVDEHHFWVNTNDASDRAYLESLAQQYPDFFKLDYREVFDQTLLFESIWQYFQGCTEDGTLYIRLDDDICYIAPDALPNLVSFRRRHPEAFLVYGNIINNAICSYYQQANGVIPKSWGIVGRECMDPIGWDGKRFAQRLHELFLRDIHTGKTERWKYAPQTLSDYPRFSINVISWFGQDMRKSPALTRQYIREAQLVNPVDGRLIENEECMVSQYLPAIFRRPNVICGDALFGHFAYYPQRRYLEGVTTLLDEYRDLAYPQHGVAHKVQRRVERAVKPIRCVANGPAWKFLKRKMLRQPAPLPPERMRN
jgi:hypothetical protein